MARVLSWIVAAGLLAILAVVLIHPEPMLSPGPLMRAHAALASDCFACHRPLLGSTPEKCMKCHERDRIGLFTTRGAPIEGKSARFHQELLDQNCTDCHTDHVGPDARRAMHAFAHELLEPQIRAKCSHCHTPPDDGLHRGVRENCSSCHSSRAWVPASFDHDRYFVLDRDHNVECRTCHLEDTFETYSCYGCHEHRPAGVREEHLEEGIRDVENCVECHRSADEPEKRGRDHEVGDDQEPIGDPTR